HIYKMDYSELIRDHIESEADATVGCIPVSLEEGTQFGVMQIDDSRRILDFAEKPAKPKPSPEDPTQCLASMGIYVFNANFLFEQLCRDATDRNSSHDFGKNIIPGIIDSHDVRAFPFKDRNSGNRRYWRDVGTLDSYYEANIDLVSVNPNLNLYDSRWPIRTYQPPLPPPKFVFNYDEGPRSRVGKAVDSLVCSGSIVSGGEVERSILSSNVRVNSWASVKNSILFEGVEIGREAQVQNAIIDKNVVIPENTSIGFDLEEDRARGFVVTESGIVVIGKSDSLGDFQMYRDSA
ncbi:MAG: glucose-1-phosphate adenylyltransferase, partial [Planctomycetaceae bacterium]|nr:glucose-1-phosphate adenylyltransferase [Planctomycetaceae bacterium]